MFTKDVNFIEVDVEEYINNFNKILSKMLKEAIGLINSNNKIVKLNNLEYDYDVENGSMYLNLAKNRIANYYGAERNKYEIEKDIYNTLNLNKNFKWRIMNKKETLKIALKSKRIQYIDLIGNASETSLLSYEENGNIKSMNVELTPIQVLDRNDKAYLIIPTCTLIEEKDKRLQENYVLKIWIKNKLIPWETSLEKEYKIIENLSKYDVIDVDENSIFINKKKFTEIFASSEIKELISDEKINQEKNYLLECDKIRADIEEYDEKILTDPNRGHWDLYTVKDSEDYVKIPIETPMIARNPKADIKYGGVVGIDFGTKSTVVVHQEDSEYTLPMRVGIGQFRKKIDSKHYENPTVMEFINLDEFEKDYKAAEGRPKTKWEDVTISHTAFSSFMNSKSDEYYAYFSELKQWCSGKNKRIRIRDKNKKIYDLPPFIEIKGGDFDPIEIYAYYLGLYINNMHNGIYLDYILSFPITYEKEVKDKVVESFERGIKKSLPSQIIEDEEVMESFRVSEGASEPAAYAISALQEYGFEPEDEENIFYGVFDFGGGTTDFDFGIFREANGKRERKYDFVIEHFGAGGDRYLGGENLLELMAFELLKKNSDILREKNITFLLPPESKKFPGSEVLLSESQEAKINMRHVMEKLRPLWERKDNYKEEYSKGIIATNMFDKNGNIVTNFQLKIDEKELEDILRERIEKGVRNFFESLRMAFDNEKISDVKKINIFLAGNSSKSDIVREMFEEYIKRESEEIIKSNINVEDKSNLEKELKENKIFEVFPPLGTEEAYKLQEELGIEVCRDNFKKPTGKTGVAFGIVESRPGGRIKVINMNQENKEAKFRFFVGENRRKKFKYIISTESKYNEWVEFTDAYEEDFEIYYTSLPEASTNSLAISDVLRIKCRLKETFEDDDVFVYLRPITPTEVEYVVAKEEGIKNNEYLTEVVKIQLN